MMSFIFQVTPAIGWIFFSFRLFIEKTKCKYNLLLFSE
ncbi:Uncharacterised protein [Klebsiella pneumoniae]|uniref:Uncharacterized protein n=1 Tax=Klebsiella pneumoniae TaxID=573 RepID=A0A2X3GST6_KLEPN|nr:Uncharacterised protein [Klebsiella pneumoniae]